MNAAEFLTRLEKVKRTAEGEWVACCPAHEDRSPSLAVKEAQDGRILVHCFAGCGYKEICDATGISVLDLFQDKPLTEQSLKPLPYNPRTLLKAMAFNAQIVAIAASDICAGKTIAVADKDKLFEIAREMEEVANGAR